VIKCSDFYPLSNQINLFTVIHIWGIIIIIVVGPGSSKSYDMVFHLDNCMFIGNTYTQASLISLIKEANVFTNHAFQTMKTIAHCGEIIPNIIYCHINTYIYYYMLFCLCENYLENMFFLRELWKQRLMFTNTKPSKNKTFEGHKKLVYINYIGFKSIFGWPISNCFPGTWCLK